MKYFLFSIILILISCGKEKFATNKLLDRYKAKDIEKLDFTGKEFSKFTTVKPKVDFLFLWDNSSSTKLISPETQWAMANTINLISENFDYRIILSPLLGDETPHPFHESFIVSENDSYISDDYLKTKWRYPGSGSYAIFNLLNRGSLENGITRAYILTSAGFANGIYRTGAHMIMVILSNGDDNSWMGNSNFPSGIDQTNYVNNYANKFITLRNSKNSKTFRFLSVVPSSGCLGSKSGITYQMLSNKLYTYQQQSGFPANVQPGPPDNFDFCNMQSFYNLFDGINAAISPENIPYKYIYWPITTKQSWRYDTNLNNVRVSVKDGAGNFIKSLPYSETDGWSFEPGYKTLNIIECPIHKEFTCDSEKAKVMVTGYFIKLNGSARISNPSYIDVFTQTPPDFYGYVRIKYKPWIDQNKGYSDSIRIKINGIQVPKDGFEEPIYRENFNVKIRGQGDFTPDSEHPLIQTGYFLKLKSTFVFGAGDSVEVDYYPSGT